MTAVPLPDLETAPRRWGPALILAFASVVTLVWTVTAVRATGRGFDLTDEGFYLLSYRWWNDDHRTFSGVQYLYGPVFALLGHDVAGLRLFRVGTVLGVHLIFGLAFMRWLRPSTRLWEAAGTACIVAAGGAMFAWLPHTPGYNDVVLLGALLALAALLSCEDGRPWWPLLLGAVAVAMVLTKWSTILWLAVLLPLLFLQRRRAVLWAAAGAALTVGVIHVFLVPLDVAVPQIITVNRLLSERSFAVTDLLHRYAESTRPTVVAVARDYGLLLLAGVAAAVARRPAFQIAAAALGLAGLTWAVFTAIREGGLDGGPPNALLFPVPMLAALSMAAAVGVASHLASWSSAVSASSGRARVSPPALAVLADRDRVSPPTLPVLADGDRVSPPALAVLADGDRVSPPALAVLADRDRVSPPAAGAIPNVRGRAWLLPTIAAMPVITAFGTSNAPLKLATPAFAAWVAVLIAVLTGIDRRAVVARGLVGAVVAGSLLVTACVATGGLWRNPYREKPFDGATTASGVPALSGLDLQPAQARAYRDLRSRLEPYLTPGRRVVGLDKMAGVVFLLDGRTVGEGWYAPEDPERTRIGIAAACAGGPPWPADQAPIVLLDRPVRAADASVLAPCGLDLTRDYRPLPPAAGLTVLVPART